MKGLINVILIVSVVTLVLSVITKYTYGVTSAKGMVAGVGPTGYLNVTMVLLLIGANLALLELLKKK